MRSGLANAVVGIWLMSSAFSWLHSPTQFVVSLACGAVALSLLERIGRSVARGHASAP